MLLSRFKTRLLFVFAERQGDSGGAIVNERGELLGIITNNVDPKELLTLISSQKEVFSGRNYITIATAVPPQLITAILNSKNRLNLSATKGNVERGWEYIFLTEPAVKTTGSNPD